tara:strand:- start:151 stop:867 length:717 start_codon:yes stop_codon:yes gene_type:complete
MDICFIDKKNDLFNAVVTNSEYEILNEYMEISLEKLNEKFSKNYIIIGIINNLVDLNYYNLFNYTEKNTLRSLNKSLFNKTYVSKNSIKKINFIIKCFIEINKRDNVLNTIINDNIIYEYSNDSSSLEEINVNNNDNFSDELEYCNSPEQNLSTNNNSNVINNIPCDIETQKVENIELDNIISVLEKPNFFLNDDIENTSNVIIMKDDDIINNSYTNYFTYILIFTIGIFVGMKFRKR